MYNITYTSEFITAISRFSKTLYEWTLTPLSVDFLEAIIQHPDKPNMMTWTSDNPNPELAAFEERMFSDTISRTKGYYLSIEDAEDTFSCYLGTAALILWNSKMQFISRTNSPVDNIVRKYISASLGEGVGYLCLLVAKEAIMVERFLNEIELSRSLTPKLPFSSSELEILRTAVGEKIGDTRIRLTMILALSLGRVSNKFGVHLTIYDFGEGIRNMIKRYVSSSTNELSNLFTEDLNNIMTALVVSKSN